MSENKEEKKGSFWGKLKGLAFEEVAGENSKSEETTTAAPTNNASAYNYANLGTPGAGVNPAVGSFDQRFYDGFQEVLKTNNIDGVDYFEFASVKKMFDTTMAGAPDAAKAQQAFNALKATNPDLTKQHLLSTADFYLEKIAKEEAEFKSEMQKEIENSVNSKLASAKQKQDSIVSKQEQIAALQAEIAELGNGIAKDNAEAQAAQNNIDATAKNFDVTINVFRSEINKHKSEIESSIQ